jgi:hypothetical protein
MTLESLLGTAKVMVPGVTVAELAVVAAVWMHVYLDGESEDQVIRWARKFLGTTPSGERLVELRRAGASIRQIAAATGLPKSTVARLTSQAAA